MDYGRLLRRAWDIIWEHKFLILLGVLVALGSAGGGGGANVDINVPPHERGPDFNFRPPDLEGEWGLPVALIAVAAAGLIGVALLVAVALWAVSTIARGGLIAGVSAVDSGTPSDFGQAWRAGWRRGWTLLGIGVLPAIPGAILALTGLGTAAALGGTYLFRGEVGPRLADIGLVAPLMALACVLVPIGLALSLLRTFANRACMLENLGVFASYRRGVEVLLENFGPALILFLLQVVISIGLGIAFFLPNVLMALCCLLWPVLLLVRGAIAAYFSTLWTLAWREWTGG